ncbi:MAG: methyltransferase domain-containing protein [Luteitalea sp.]|nr:methyltransferase domain-containing protein [Luteitalea sp.]
MAMWNRLRYTIWAPIYDALVTPAHFEDARRRSIQHLALQRGDRVLIVGAGTGLDLEYLPKEVLITAVDVTPAMLARLRDRAQRLGVDVETHVLDARRLPFDSDTFDAVVLHLVLAVMPNPDRGLQEAERVLKPGGRVGIFDKFLRDDEQASVARRLLNLVVKPLFSDLNRKLGPLVKQTRLEIEHDEPVAFGGLFRVVALKKPSTVDS